MQPPLDQVDIGHHVYVCKWGGHLVAHAGQSDAYNPQRLCPRAERRGSLQTKRDCVFVRLQTFLVASATELPSFDKVVIPQACIVSHAERMGLSMLIAQARSDWRDLSFPNSAHDCCLQLP